LITAKEKKGKPKRVWGAEQEWNRGECPYTGQRKRNEHRNRGIKKKWDDGRRELGTRVEN